MHDLLVQPEVSMILLGRSYCNWVV